MTDHEKTNFTEPKKRMKVSLADLQRYNSLSSEEERQLFRVNYETANGVRDPDALCKVGSTAINAMACSDIDNSSCISVESNSVGGVEKEWSAEFEQRFSYLRDRPIAVHFWRTGTSESSTGITGFQSRTYNSPANIMLGRAVQPKVLQGFRLGDADDIERHHTDSGIAEVIVVKPLIAFEHKNNKVTKQVRKKGLFSSKLVDSTVDEKIIVKRPMAMGDLTGKSDAAPVTQIGYWPLMRSGLADGLNSTRNGACFYLSAAVYDHEAKELAEFIKENPKRIREFSQFILKEVIDDTQEFFYDRLDHNKRIKNIRITDDSKKPIDPSELYPV